MKADYREPGSPPDALSRRIFFQRVGTMAVGTAAVALRPQDAESAPSVSPLPTLPAGSPENLLLRMQADVRRAMGRPLEQRRWHNDDLFFLGYGERGSHIGEQHPRTRSGELRVGHGGEDRLRLDQTVRVVVDAGELDAKWYRHGRQLQRREEDALRSGVLLHPSERLRPLECQRLVGGLAAARIA